jgi:3-hydroxyacyl-CoA dehydrogenase/enoyl-CoA hydratase/3-hydroxybutyryl-CoA epimerase
VLSYIDGMGAKKFVKIAKELQKKYGAEFKAPKLLIDMAEKGESFYQRFDPYVKSEEKKAA